MFKISIPKWCEQMRNQFKKNPHLVYGLPFMTVILLGPFILKHFGEVRYEFDLFDSIRIAHQRIPYNITYIYSEFQSNYRYKYRKVKVATEKDLEEFGIKMKTPSEEITLEGEYEKLKEMDIDSWEQVRGPRPWEENFGTESKESKE